MKRLFVLLSLLIPLTSCTFENDFYGDGFYRQPPRARVEVPYGYSYQANPRTYHHDHDESIAYKGSVRSNRSVRSQRHEHDDSANTNNYVDTRVHGHESIENRPIHGHDDEVAESNIHGHD
ncbi:Uncharacterised protein [Legionella lansingensis]|uniref:Lipoprotein n=1 Tax=Legionella lansingensis TaxID=45067 RepID=A0A0W0VFH1_9GAMM|nr:hypothetical protein [Legionella lansingensis]KTD18847.1 hypothetical protein Llan_2450 [Legionella lansingensis]SNV52805.1 Uncharacterised protein [Legionella lansingensis]